MLKIGDKTRIAETETIGTVVTIHDHSATIEVENNRRITLPFQALITIEKDFIITWICPDCDFENSDDYLTTMFPMCANCDHDFDWRAIADDETLSRAYLAEKDNQ